jgi:hypothetical protein
MEQIDNTPLRILKDIPTSITRNQLYNFEGRKGVSLQKTTPSFKKKKSFNISIGAPVPNNLLTTGIATGVYDIKIFHQNLSKMITEDIIQLQTIQSIKSDENIYLNILIQKIIDKLVLIKMRVGYRMNEYLREIERIKTQNLKGQLKGIESMLPKHFYKNFVNIMNFYMTILKAEDDNEKIYNEYVSFLTNWLNDESKQNVGFINDLYDNTLKYIKKNYQKTYENLYKPNYYQKLYDSEFTPKSKSSTLKGGYRNKSNYLDMKLNYVKDLCKANQIKLSTTKNDMRVIYTKKELITKLKRKKII